MRHEQRLQGMNVNVNPERLRLELACRGWNGVDLARASGLSRPTVSGALAGRPLTAKSLAAMIRALRGAPVIQGIELPLD